MAGGFMAWLPHDVGTWGLILGILTLLTAIPLGIASNLLAPKLQNWWASRSIASLQKRIEKLETRLAEVEATPLYSNFEWVAMRGIARIGWLLISAFELFLWTIIMILAVWVDTSGVPFPKSVVIALMGFFMVWVAKHGQARQMFHQAVIEGTENGRTDMRATIEKLKGKLAKKLPKHKAFQ